MPIAIREYPWALTLLASISMNIYTSEKVLPYVYMCVNRHTNKVYIGSRTTKYQKDPSHIDIQKYKTSSSIVRPDFSNFDWIIIAEFFDKNDAYDFEQQLIFEQWQTSKEHSLNKVHYFNKKRCNNFDAESRRKISHALMHRPVSEYTRRKISNSNIGKHNIHHTSEVKLKISIASKNRPQISEETRNKISSSAKNRRTTNYRKQGEFEHSSNAKGKIANAISIKANRDSVKRIIELNGYRANRKIELQKGWWQKSEEYLLDLYNQLLLL